MGRFYTLMTTPLILPPAGAIWLDRVSLHNQQRHTVPVKYKGRVLHRLVITMNPKCILKVVHYNIIWNNGKYLLHVLHKDCPLQ